jgi:two-component system response regulator
MLENEGAEILLIEDDPDEAELALEALRRCGASARVTRVHDGEAALNAIFSGPGATVRLPAPRLILLDLKLPKVDGFGVLKRLKADATAKSIPVVVLTSSKMDEDVLRSYELGANSYIVKPIDFGEFSAAVERLGAYWLALNRGV